MTEHTTEQMVLDPSALITTSATGVSPMVSASAEDQSDIVSQAFTSVEQDEQPVQYVTMTPEEAAAHGVMEEDQVVTTSLQFDPANPNVLYTADGQLINRADLSPEEQALVQAALQQHLAEQEAEAQLQQIDQEGAATNQGMDVAQQQTQQMAESSTAMSEEKSNLDSELLANSTVTSNAATTNVNLASPNTNAAQIVQTLANNVRRQQEYAKAQNLLQQARATEKPALPQGYRYEEKIVIRQGQPHVMKMPVKKTGSSKKMPELPAALANLMPKVDIGKDGNQVIRIHQSQITAEQLKSLQENPNVRLVFRPPSGSRRGGRGGAYTGKRRGRPRKNPYQTSRGSPEPTTPTKNFDDSSPPATTRYGRQTKLPYFSKDYTTGENGDLAEEMTDNKSNQNTQYQQNFAYTSTRGRRGRPRGGGSSSRGTEKAYRRSGTYASRMDMIREHQMNNDEELEASHRLSMVPPKPAMTVCEQAISNRRKTRLRELLSNCSEEDIMEVTLPHLARVFSLWEYLVMKVEKNKVSRVYFADVYKEYESLHKYVSRLAEQYFETVNQKKSDEEQQEQEKMDTGELNENNPCDDSKNDDDKEKPEIVPIKCRKLAESLGLTGNNFEDALIELIGAKLPDNKEQIVEEQVVSEKVDEMVTDVSSSVPVAPVTEEEIINNPSLLMTTATLQQQLAEQEQEGADLLTNATATTADALQQQGPDVMDIIQSSLAASDSLEQVQQDVGQMFATTTDEQQPEQQQQTEQVEAGDSVTVVTEQTAVKQEDEQPDDAAAAALEQLQQQIAISDGGSGETSQAKGDAATVETEAAAVVTTEAAAAAGGEVLAAAVATAEVTDAGAVEAMQVDQAEQPGVSGQQQQQVATEEVMVNEEDIPTIEAAENGTTIVPASSNGSQIIQIGTGDDRQYIEVPEGYTLIQTPNGLVMSQPGTQIRQDEDGTIYVTNEDGTCTPLDAQKSFPLETVESLLSLDGQQQQ